MKVRLALDSKLNWSKTIWQETAYCHTNESPIAFCRQWKPTAELHISLQNIYLYNISIGFVKVVWALDRTEAGWGCEGLGGEHAEQCGAELDHVMSMTMLWCWALTTDRGVPVGAGAVSEAGRMSEGGHTDSHCLPPVVMYFNNCCHILLSL